MLLIAAYVLACGNCRSRNVHSNSLCNAAALRKWTMPLVATSVCMHVLGDHGTVTN